MSVTLRINKKIKSAGEGQDFLREVVLQINRGIRHGLGWKIDDTQVQLKDEVTLDPELNNLTLAIKDILQPSDSGRPVEEVTDVLQALHIKLVEHGYGKEEDKATKETSVAPGVDLGAPEGDKNVETVVDTTKKEEVEDRIPLFPWQKRKN